MDKFTTACVEESLRKCYEIENKSDHCVSSMKSKKTVQLQLDIGHDNRTLKTSSGKNHPPFCVDNDMGKSAVFKHR